MTSPKNDRGGVRTAQELERKYSFENLKQGIKDNLYQLQKVNRELEVFVEKTLGDISKIEKQIDGKVEAYFCAGVPSIDNVPTINWEELEIHVNDLYYDTETGNSYRFSKNETNYLWKLLDDKETSVALATINATQDAEDGKVRIFVEQPSPPYEKGDLWLYENEIYICVDEKKNGNFSKGDFEIAANYDERLNVVAKYLTAVRADVGQFKEVVSSNIVAINAAITILNTNKASISDLQALSAYVTKLEADFLTADKADLVYAKIESLKALSADILKLNADKVDVNKANIDAAWITDLLVIGKFLANDVNGAVGNFSKYLTGVNIVGDNITAGTIKTDRLIIRDAGSDTGILFALNNGIVEQTNLTAEELKRLALDGSIIVAQSITADKINVTDLFAQDIISTGDFNMGGSGALYYNAETDELSIRAKEISLQSGKLATAEDLQTVQSELLGNINTAEEELKLHASESAENFKKEASKTYATKDEVATEKTKVDILSDKFKVTQQTIDNIHSYMTFENGELVIGKSDGDIKSVQDNDSYQFVDKSGNSLLEINTKGVNSPTVNVEKQVTYFSQWAMRKGAYVNGEGYNLNDVWIGG